MGTVEGRIMHILQIQDEEGAYVTFNKRMDALYSEDLRGEDGKLPNIVRGPFGLDGVVVYLEECMSLDERTFQWEAAMPKLRRLIDEVQKHNKYVTYALITKNHLKMRLTLQ